MLDPRTPKSVGSQRLAGVFLIVVGGGMTYYIWHLALTQGRYSLKAAFLFPAFCIFGLMPLLYPQSREQWIAKQAKSTLGRFADYRFGQFVILILGLAAGVLNASFISGKLPLP